MQWWCAASDLGWDWRFRAYPGVWLVVLALAVMALRRPGREVKMTVAGLAAVWLALDWPIGALGAGYLLSVHQFQYLLLVMIAPPLLWKARAVPAAPAWFSPAAAWLARPVPAIIVCNAIVIGTHLPTVVDGWMATQFGSFTLDLSWLAAGLILWRPVVDRSLGFTHGMRFGYLIAVTLLPGFPAAFFFFADYPLYALYELAPPISWLPTMQDQFVAGIVMKLGGFIIVIAAMTRLFFQWYAADGGVPATMRLPDAVPPSNSA